MWLEGKMIYGYMYLLKIHELNLNYKFERKNHV